MAAALKMSSAVAGCPNRAAATITSVRANPPLSTSRDAKLVCAALDAQRSVGLEARLATKATCTEAGLLARAGLEAIVLGPGPSIGNVHKPNEHTSVAQLHRAVELYRALLVRLACLVCSGRPTCS